MDQNSSNEDREKKFYEARVKENEDKIAAVFKSIFRKGHELTQEDIAFLYARQSFMTREQRDEYKEEFAEFERGINGERTLENMTRKELEAKALEVGIEDPSKTSYRTNADLIAAIQEADQA